MSKNTSLVKIILTLCLSFLACSSSALAAASDASPRIAVLSFKVNAAKDMSYIKTGIRDMISSRLASRVGAVIISPALVDKAAAGMGGLDTPELILSIGRTLSADYIISGSFTSFAGSTSIDALLQSVKTSDSLQRFSASASQDDEMIQAIDSLTWDIAEKSFSRERPSLVTRSTYQQAASSQAAPPATFQSAHPDRYLMGRYGAGAGSSGSQLLRPMGVVTSPMGFSKSQNIKFGLVDMVVGDVDGDGDDEFILASRREVRIYRQIGRKMQQVAKVSTPYNRYKIHSVTLADLNSDGIKEIYVSAADAEDPNSFILEWDGQKYKEIARDKKWYIRAMEIPGEGVVLAGQKSSMNHILSRGIYRLNLSGSSLVRGEKIAVKGVNLFDFTLADLDGDGKNEMIAISQGDKLMVLRPSGRLLWTSDDNYGGTTRFIGGESTADTARNLENGADYLRIFIPARVIIRDVNNDGQLDVIVNKNSSNISRVMARYRSYPSGEIHALTWNGIGLTQLWRTRKIDGYIADYDMGPTRMVSQTDKDGNLEEKSMAELHVGLVLANGGVNLFKDSRSTVLTFPIELVSDEK